MKRTILAIALTSLLAACGSAGSDAQPPAPVAQDPAQAQQAEQPKLPETSLPPTTLPEVEKTPEVAPEVKPEPKPEAPKVDVMKESDHLDPMSNTTGTPFKAPQAEEEPVPEWQQKFLNLGVARAVAEYRMVGESLRQELAAEMGGGVDAWINKDVERCIADTIETFRHQTETNKTQSKLMCTGQAYGYWAIVNGTAGTEGSPRQCLEKGYCGYMFKQYDLTADPVFQPTNGLDGQE